MTYLVFRVYTDAACNPPRVMYTTPCVDNGRGTSEQPFIFASEEEATKAAAQYTKATRARHVVCRAVRAIDIATTVEEMDA